LRRLITARVAGVVVVVLLAGWIVAAQIPASAADTVTTTSVPGTATTTTAEFPRINLDGASCAAHSCIVVGEEDLGEQVALSFAERWAGGVLKQEPMPQPSRTTKRTGSLSGVSCWSVRGCLAVGYFFPSCCQMKAFAEEWTGSRWKLQRDIGPHVSPGYQLSGVSCPAARYCIAVGDGSNDNGPGNTVGLVEQWDGRRWIRDPSPNPKTTRGSGQAVSLTNVACADPGDCVAIGSYSNGAGWSRPLAEIYADGKWLIRSPTDPKRSATSQLDSIACPTSTECVAVGGSFAGFVPGAGMPAKKAEPLAELWNGRDWTVQRLPSPAGSVSSLNSVSCGSPTSCTALGEISGTPVALLIEHWNGHRWKRQAIPSPLQLTDPGFVDISCATSRTCTAVGESPAQDPVIAQVVGTRWTVLTPT